jgi:hypothetical protein
MSMPRLLKQAGNFNDVIAVAAERGLTKQVDQVLTAVAIRRAAVLPTRCRTIW